HTAPPPTEPYTLSLHDALPISPGAAAGRHEHARAGQPGAAVGAQPPEGLVASDRTTEAGRGLVLRRGPLSAFQLTLAAPSARDEIGKHTSELQSLRHLVCRLLL